MAEKNEKKDVITRIRRSKKQILIDKISALYKDVPEGVLTQNMERIEKIIDTLEEARQQVKKTRKINFERLTRNKSKEEIAYMIEQLQKQL